MYELISIKLTNAIEIIDTIILTKKVTVTRIICNLFQGLLNNLSFNRFEYQGASLQLEACDLFCSNQKQSTT